MEQTKRLLSLDVFRGITIAGMILVNNPGSWSTVYPPLLHADWHGCTPTDWVFPFFLFIVGVAIPYAIGGRLKRGDSKAGIQRKIIRRTLVLFGLGVFLNAFPFFTYRVVEASSDQGLPSLVLAWKDLSNLRIPGVLQRIALVYGACGFIYLHTKWRNQFWIGLGLLLLYWVLMTLVPVPGVGAPNLEPSTNLGAWLDRLLLNGHLWSQAKTWDPEGILSTLPAVVTGLVGVLTGTWLKTNRDAYQKITGLLGMGVIILAVSLVWDLAFPINKKIWTSSYVLYTGGIALLFLGVLYWVIDVLKIREWILPFVMFGMNALFAYVFSSVFAKMLYSIKWVSAEGEIQSLGGWIYYSLFTPILSDYNASLAFAIGHVLVALLLVGFLYNRKIFIKV